MRKGFLIYEEMRKYFPRHAEVVSHIRLCNCSILNFLIYEENQCGKYKYDITFTSLWRKINHKPGRVACLNAGGVKTDEGPGAAIGCFATCRAEITTA
jgi:hypothetical protein